MAKNKNGKQDLPEENLIEIIGAKLKDEFCSYSYEYTKGVTAGDGINRNGASIVHEDMATAFSKLNVHLAHVCEEVDKNLVHDVDTIESYNDEEHRADSIEAKISKFKVAAFKVDGTGENESVVLIGTKRLSTGDNVELKTPKINWNGDYLFINELRASIDEVKNEVALYMNGKTAPKMVQQEIDFEPQN